MSVSVSLFLYGKPGHDSDKEGSDITNVELQSFLEGIRAELERLATIFATLAADGWAFQMGLYEVEVSHVDVTTEADARGQLQTLGLDPDDFVIYEEEDDEEEAVVADA